MPVRRLSFSSKKAGGEGERKNVGGYGAQNELQYYYSPKRHKGGSSLNCCVCPTLKREMGIWFTVSIILILAPQAFWILAHKNPVGLEHVKILEVEEVLFCKNVKSLGFKSPMIYNVHNLVWVVHLDILKGNCTFWIRSHVPKGFGIPNTTTHCDVTLSRMRMAVTTYAAERKKQPFRFSYDLSCIVHINRKHQQCGNTNNPLGTIVV